LTEPARAGGGALALLAALCIAWGTNWPMMKIALAEIPVWTFRSLTCIAASAAILLIARLRAGAFWPRDAAEWRTLAVAGFWNVTVWQVTVAYGVQLMGSGHAAVLAFTMPLWSGLFSVLFLGEGLSRRLAAAIALGTAGVLVLVARGADAFHAGPAGPAFVLVAAIGWAIGTLYLKNRRFSLGTLAATGWQLALGSVPIVLLTPLLEPVAWPQASAAAWACVAFVAFIAIVVGYLSWFSLVKVLPANVAAVSSLAVPVVALLSGAVALGEPLGAREAVATALIVAALALALIRPDAARG
jgi:drug/metabolite transporter (DMT)-like permease